MSCLSLAAYRKCRVQVLSPHILTTRARSNTHWLATTRVHVRDMHTCKHVHVRAHPHLRQLHPEILQAIHVHVWTLHTLLRQNSSYDGLLLSDMTYTGVVRTAQCTAYNLPLHCCGSCTVIRDLTAPFHSVNKAGKMETGKQ
jgi:hypothetical protein